MFAKFYQIFNSADKSFSQSFKKQFSIQLENAFNKLTGIENFAQKRSFLIPVGLEEINITYRDGYGFGSFTLCTPQNLGVQQTSFGSRKAQ
ncbi:MAG: hypothetical protein HRT58_21530 [Crocinitomicaceae bacterium]|nr:hypothetical protein [Flavobacteriales bacterium]NQZ38256.1 hypothetical protein [Crocinitomicaceae bacterium]